MINLRTICQHCGAGCEIPYVLLGAEVQCPVCGGRTILRLPPGEARPMTRYELTFEDFRRLISDADYRTSIAPLLRRWFGHELEVEGGAVRVRSLDGRRIDPVSLHLDIQRDEEKQSALYRAAMTLWR